MHTILVTGDFLVDHYIYEGQRHHFGEILRLIIPHQRLQLAADARVVALHLQRRDQEPQPSSSSSEPPRVHCLVDVDTLGVEVEKSRGYIARSAGQAQLAKPAAVAAITSSFTPV